VGYHAGKRFDLITGLGVANGKTIGSRFFGIPYDRRRRPTDIEW